MKKLLFVAVTALFLSCNKEANFTKIKVGMPLNEVVELVGEPKEQQDNPLFGKWYIYEKNIIVFRADTVAGLTTPEELANKMKGIDKDIEKLGNTLNELK